MAPGERAIIFHRFYGVLPGAINEGTHICIPWLERPIVFDVRTKPRAIKSTTGTRGMPGARIGGLEMLDAAADAAFMRASS